MQSFDAMTLSDLNGAQERIHRHIIRTPLLHSKVLSDLTGLDVFLKCENMQITGSFKIRGVFNKLLRTVAAGGVETGVVASSSGNHGHAMAYATATRGVPCTVVVPDSVAPVKAQAIADYGAHVIRHGTTSTERVAFAQAYAADRGLTYVSSHDDLDIIAGQATVGLEILEQVPNPGTILVPVGGGGLLAGVALAVKQTASRMRVVGVQPGAINSIRPSLAAGHPVDVGECHTIADGLRVNRLGRHPFPVLEAFVDTFHTVGEDSILQALHWLLFREKLLVEPSGATTVAALLGADWRGPGPIICMISGGNVGAEALRRFMDIR